MNGLSHSLINPSGWSTLFATGVIVTISTLSFVFLSYSSRATESDEGNSSDDSADSLFNPLILKSHSEFRSFITTDATYKSIRTFYHPHPRAEKLPSVSKLPLLVFVHGLGGSLAQFTPLLGSLRNIAPCFGIDLPGCGLSSSSPCTFNAYKIEALAKLIKIVVEEACQEHQHESVILVGHSYGCPISTLLSSKNSPADLKLCLPVQGVIFICPKASRPTKSQSTIYRMLFALPNFCLNGLRRLDRRGGIESTSVTRFVGVDADLDLKLLQLEYNEHFRTSVWKRTALGAVPTYDSNGKAHGGLPGKDIWSGLDIPLLLIAGEADIVTNLEELDLILSYLKHNHQPIANASSQSDLEANGDLDSPKADDRSFGVQASTTESESHHATVIKTAILPAPASHALLYDHAFYRTVAGLIEDFLANHVSEQLSLAKQLQQLTTSGKWDVKNLDKWKQVMPVSGPMAGGLFRAVKTLREQDEEHTPAKFVQKWKGQIYAVVDISHDRPIYNTQTLEKGGIQYHKFPTVSKVPPTLAEVKGFIALVERLRKEIASSSQSSEASAIACHCHYGYNRTGFFIICYMVEKENYRLQDAIDEFARQKPPGIRHDHFLDTLFVRYCVGLRKAPTST